MGGDDLRRRIVDQFSYRGERAAIWRLFDRFLETGAFLNLGYSPPGWPHVLGSSQRRLAAKVGRDVAGLVGRTAGERLLDVGCGRGGPTIHLAAAHGFDALGVDLVPYNVERARRNARREGSSAAFAIGDATRLPAAPDAFAAATAIDSGVYVREKEAFLRELAGAVRGGGIVAVADLVAAETGGVETADRLAAFADAWDFAPVEALSAYRDRLGAAGFEVVRVEDISPNSTDRFRKWARLFLALERAVPGVMARWLGRRGIDLDAIAAQVRATERALPYLRHVIVYARR